MLGGFNAANYRTERLWATAEDGTEVPISLVYRPDMVKKDGSDHLLLYACAVLASGLLDPYACCLRVELALHSRKLWRAVPKCSCRPLKLKYAQNLLQVRRVRDAHRRLVRRQPAVTAGPRLRVGHCPCPRRRRHGPPVVRVVVQHFINSTST